MPVRSTILIPLFPQNYGVYPACRTWGIQIMTFLLGRQSNRLEHPSRVLFPSLFSVSENYHLRIEASRQIGDMS